MNTKNGLPQRLKSEIRHGSEIASNAENVWGWQSPAGRLRAERRIASFLEKSRLHKNSLCLELGCGTGLFTTALSKSCDRLVGVDISWDLLRQAREKLGDSPRAQCVLTDIHSMAFRPKLFDIVLGVSVLHHLEYETALKEIRRVLKPGGILILSEPNLLNPQIFFQKNIPWLKKRMGDSPYETAFLRWSITRLLLRLDFHQVEAIPFDFLHPLVPTPCIPLVNRIGQALEKFPIVREFAGSILITAIRAKT